MHTKLGDFVKLDLQFMTMWINRLVPSPSRFENRQWSLVTNGYKQGDFLWSQCTEVSYKIPDVPLESPQRSEHVAIETARQVFRKRYNDW